MNNSMGPTAPRRLVWLILFLFCWFDPSLEAQGPVKKPKNIGVGETYRTKGTFTLGAILSLHANQNPPLSSQFALF